jgi:hypothetical protein
MAMLQLPTDNCLARSINAMHLEDRLGDVETDCRDKIGSALICGELSNGSAALPLYPFWPGYIINMSGYDFRKGQVSPHRTRLI